MPQAIQKFIRSGRGWNETPTPDTPLSQIYYKTCGYGARANKLLSPSRRRKFINRLIELGYDVPDVLTLGDFAKIGSSLTHRG